MCPLLVRVRAQNYYAADCTGKPMGNDVNLVGHQWFIGLLLTNIYVAFNLN